MPAGSTLLKFPFDLPLSVRPTVLQKDRDAFGLLNFQHNLWVHVPLLITTDCQNECITQKI